MRELRIEKLSKHLSLYSFPIFTSEGLNGGGGGGVSLTVDG